MAADLTFEKRSFPRSPLCFRSPSQRLRSAHSRLAGNEVFPCAWIASCCQIIQREGPVLLPAFGQVGDVARIIAGKITLRSNLVCGWPKQAAFACVGNSFGIFSADLLTRRLADGFVADFFTTGRLISLREVRLTGRLAAHRFPGLRNLARGSNLFALRS